VGVQEHPEAIDLALDLGRVDGTAAHDAQTVGSSAGSGHAIDGRQASFRQPGAYLLPQFVISGG